MQKLWRWKAEDVAVLLRGAALEKRADGVALLDGEALPSTGRI